jgi:Ca-activated chloride channel family protein
MPHPDTITTAMSALAFARPWVLLGLLALPVLLFLLWRAERLSRRAVGALVAQRLLPLLSTQVNWGARRAIGGLRVLGLALVIVALAGPRMGYVEVERETRGLDVILAVDTSRSMLAQDIKPDRLTRTRLAALDLAGALKGDRLALVAFAGGGFLQVPLTVDYLAMRESIQALDTDVIPTQGTNFADAIRLALDAFGNADQQSRAIVIFSDGEECSGDVAAQVRELTSRKIPVFTVGVGTAEGGPIPVKDDYGNQQYHRDANGKIVQTKLQEPSLQELAQQTGGEYFRLEETPRLAEVLQERLQRVNSDASTVTNREPLERYQWPLAAGLILLVAAQMLGDRRERPAVLARSGARRTAIPAEPPVPRPPARRGGFRKRMLRNLRRTVDPVSRVLLVGALAIALAPRAEAKSLGEQALDFQKQGNDAKALELYQQQLRKDPGSPLADQLNFNAGIAAFKQGKTDEAIRGFSQSLLSENKGLQEQSHYNLGKSFFKRGADEKTKDPKAAIEDWERSVEQYQNALKLNSENTKARANLDYTRQQLEELKKQQPPQNQQKQDEQKQDQEKENQQDKQDQQQKQEQKDKQDEEKQDEQDQEKRGGGEKQDDKNLGGGGSKVESDQQQKPGEQAQNEGQKDGQQSKEQNEQARKEDEQTGPGNQRPEKGEDHKAGEEEGEYRKDQKITPSIDDTAKKEDQPKPGQGGEVQASPSNESGQEQSKGDEEKAVAALSEPGRMTRQEAASLLESLNSDEANGVILESRSGRNPPGKDW